MKSSSDLMVRTSMLIFDIKDMILSTNKQQKDVLEKCQKLVDMTKVDFKLVINLLDSEMICLNYFSGFFILNKLNNKYLSEILWLSKIRTWILSPKDNLLIYISLKILTNACQYKLFYKEIVNDNDILEKIIEYTNHSTIRIREIACNLIIELCEYEHGAIIFSELYAGLIGYRLLYSDYYFLRLSGIKLMETMSWFNNFNASLAGTSVIETINKLISHGDYDFNKISLLVLLNLSKTIEYKQKIIDNKELIEQFLIPFLDDKNDSFIQLYLLKFLKNLGSELKSNYINNILFKYCIRQDLSENLYNHAFEILEQCNIDDEQLFKHLLKNFDGSDRKNILLSTFGSNYVVKNKWKPILDLDNDIKLKILNTISYCQKFTLKEFNKNLVNFIIEQIKFNPELAFSTLENLSQYIEFANYLLKIGVKDIIKNYVGDDQKSYCYDANISLLNFIEVLINHSKILVELKKDINISLLIFQFVKKSKLKKNDFYQAIEILFKLNNSYTEEVLLEIM